MHYTPAFANTMLPAVLLSNLKMKIQNENITESAFRTR